jgi:hypothetical protein
MSDEGVQVAIGRDFVNESAPRLAIVPRDRPS